MKEEWKDIEGYEELYRVSKAGRVESLPRRGRPGRMLKPMRHFDGRVQVNLWKDGKLSTKKIHRLVAKAFKPNPHNKPQVDHINGVKHDNRAVNLRWVTAKENREYDRQRKRRRSLLLLFTRLVGLLTLRLSTPLVRLAGKLLSNVRSWQIYMVY